MRLFSRNPARVEAAGALGRVAPLLALLTLTVCVGDIISTNLGLAAGAVEINPLFAWIQGTLGGWWILPKIALHILVAAIIVGVARPAVLATVAPVVLFNAVVVVNNFTLSFA
jgi:hypothetical protein